MRTILTLLPATTPGQDASAELYGAFRNACGYADAGDPAHWASANNASRLGVRRQLTRGDGAAFADMRSKTCCKQPAR